MNGPWLKKFASPWTLTYHIWFMIFNVNISLCNAWNRPVGFYPIPFPCRITNERRLKNPRQNCVLAVARDRIYFDRSNIPEGSATGIWQARVLLLIGRRSQDRKGNSPRRTAGTFISARSGGCVHRPVAILLHEGLMVAYKGEAVGAISAPHICDSLLAYL